MTNWKDSGRLCVPPGRSRQSSRGNRRWRRPHWLSIATTREFGKRRVKKDMFRETLHLRRCTVDTTRKQSCRMSG